MPLAVPQSPHNDGCHQSGNNTKLNFANTAAVATTQKNYSFSSHLNTPYSVDASTITPTTSKQLDIPSSSSPLSAESRSDPIDIFSVSPQFSMTSEATLNSVTKEHLHADSAPADSADDYWPVEGSPISKPHLLHSWNTENSILSLTATTQWIIAGTGNGDIIIFSKETFEKEWVFKGHSASIYSLATTPDEQFLFSGSADSLVKAWDLKERKELYTIYSIYDVGDVFSVIWAPKNEYLILGAQNASIQWIKLYDKESYNATKDPSGLPSMRFDRFFDSTGPGGRLAPQQSANHKLVTTNECGNISLLEIPPKNVVQYAHYGYVYSLLIIKRTNSTQNVDEEYLVSGGGDGTVKIWNFNKDGTFQALHTLETDSSVFSMCCQDSFLYCGLAAGQVCMFDLDTRQTIRVDQIGNDDVMAMSLYGECLFRSAKGVVHKWDSKRYHRGKWQAHNGLVLASVLTDLNGKTVLVTGANDAVVSLWDVSHVVDKYNNYKDPDVAFAAFNSTHNLRILRNILLEQNHDLNSASEKDEVATFTIDHMMQTLGDFVSYKTISGHEGMYVNDCRKCATFLRNLFRHFGADSQLIPLEDGKNPIVYARFAGNKHLASRDSELNSPILAKPVLGTTEEKASRILFYGHYDVIMADSSDQWNTEPFTLTNLDGFMYGRGVSDNKGPILAAIFAVAELVQRSELENDVVFLIEGEEESGSVGFQQAITKNKELIGDIDWVLLSNSYWLDDDTPCLNYGLRGVIKVTIEVQGNHPDLHSGVYGGVYREPTLDLVNLLSKLATDEGEIIVPEFHSSVRPVTADELHFYEAIEGKLHKPGDTTTTTSQLMTRWRYPSLTIHGINVSGPSNSTLIPKTAKASLSLRIVPDQELDIIKESLCQYLTSQFGAFKTDNRLTIHISNESEPWVGDPSNRAFKVLAEALEEEWEKGEPLFIREGGSIPVVRFLEKTFSAPAAQLPCGQASDAAHLDNERLRIVNFIKARNVFRKTFKELV